MSVANAQRCNTDSPLKDIKALCDSMLYSKAFCDGIKACEAQTNCSNEELKEKDKCSEQFLNLPCDPLTKDLEDRIKGVVQRSSAKTCNLTREELTAINYYTSDGYACLNQTLRKPNQWSKKIQYLVETLNRGLLKLPAYKGFVVRGGSLPVAIKKQHAVGATVTYKAFTSTSTGSGFSGSDRFIILSKSGRPVMGYSDFAGENEILFPAYSRFKVLDTYEENGVQYYVMKEVTVEKTLQEDQKEDVLLPHQAVATLLQAQVLLQERTRKKMKIEIELDDPIHSIHNDSGPSPS